MRNTAFSHKACLGNSNVSANNTGIEPVPKASQNRIEFGPLPLGARAYLESSRIELYSC